MSQIEIIEELSKLPFEAQQQVKDYILFLSSRYKNAPFQQKETSGNLEDEPFIGIWKDRDDLTDSRTWIRNIRRSEWRAPGA